MGLNKKAVAYTILTVLVLTTLIATEIFLTKGLLFLTAICLASISIIYAVCNQIVLENQRDKDRK